MMNSKNNEFMKKLVLDDDEDDNVVHSTSNVYSSLDNDHRTDSLNEFHPLAPSPHQSDQLLQRNLSGERVGHNEISQKGSDESSYDLLVEPPSYADAIFTPYIGGESFSSGSMRDAGLLRMSSSLSPSSSTTEFLNVSVTDPQKEQEDGSSSFLGNSSYVTYLITTRTNISDYGGEEFSIRRRFKDIVTLADRLTENYRGCFIPPRPDKNVFEGQVMQKQDFVEQRRVALEKYFARLCSHPVLRRSPELRAFLLSEGKFSLEASRDVSSKVINGAVKLPSQLFGEGSQDIAQPVKTGNDLLRMFKEFKQSVANDWGGSKPAVVEDDTEFLEKKVKLEELQQHLSEASRQAEALVKAQQELGETIGELGLVFMKSAKFETEVDLFEPQNIYANDAKNLATGAVKASRYYRESNAQSVKYLDHLHEYLSLMQAVNTAFTDRSNALLTVQTLESDISSMTVRAEKLGTGVKNFFGGDKPRGRKMEELKDEIELTKEARDCALKEYDRIKENNRVELERFEKERQRDFLEMLNGFLHTQVGYAEKMANVWVQVADEATTSTDLPGFRSQ